MVFRVIQNHLFISGGDSVGGGPDGLEQAPLIVVRISTGNESFTEGGQFLGRIVSADFLYHGAEHVGKVDKT